MIATYDSVLFRLTGVRFYLRQLTPIAYEIESVQKNGYVAIIGFWMVLYENTFGD